MNRQMKKMLLSGLITLAAMTGFFMQEAAAVTFDSGSTCIGTSDPGGHDKCLGAFAPSVNTTVQLPPDGILDYTTIYIPSGVTVWYAKNAANTPVIIRTTGNVTIEGTLSVNYVKNPSHTGTYGDGNLGDDGQPGLGGPGGFDGGFGGYSALFGGAYLKPGGGGKGPGGGQGGSGNYGSYNYIASGGGGGFGTAGAASGWGGPGGAAYGQPTLLPLVGGSGGGGGEAGSVYSGAGGGGGGGAILIAAGTASVPATISIGKNGTYGYIYADGGPGGYSSSSVGGGGGGGGGSGGAIRLVANTLACPHTSYCRMFARGGSSGSGYPWAGGNGGAGRIRLEANNITGWAASYTDPNYTFGLPGHVLVPNSPTLAINSVTPANGASSGVTATVPANPTGSADITFPTDTTSATVALAATNIPVGTTVTVYVVPVSGATRSSWPSNALDGTLASSTATATVSLSPGNNVLMAAATYTVTEIVAMNLPRFDGEMVAKVRVEGTMDGQSKVIYITSSGREYPADAGI